MNLKKWFAAIRDEEIELQERTFRIMTTVVFCIFLIVFLIGFIGGLGPVPMMAIGLMFVGFVALAAYSLKNGRVQVGATAACFVSVCAWSSFGIASVLTSPHSAQV